VIACRRLALGTVPVAARVVCHRLIAASIAD
jgi:hypothetical protein